MERQLKERLIGAAVLVAVAVIMVPEMFSGTHSRLPSPDNGAQPLQSYRIDLQAAKRSEVTEAAAVATPVEAPAERPQSEVSSSESAEASSSQSSTIATQAIVTKAVASYSADSKSTASKIVEPKPPEAKVATSAEPKLAAANSAGEWQVQVGSFSGEAKARQIAATLKAQGFISTVVPVKVADKTLYRVRVGAGAQRSSAEATLQKLKSAYPGASVVANR